MDGTSGEGSHWVGFLTGRTQAARFLAKTVAHRVEVPSPEATRRFVEVIQAKPSRLMRVVQLLQASRFSSATVQRIVADLALATVREHVAPWPEVLTEGSFHAAASSWIGSVPKKPLNPR
ncbi:MAG TPA: hypothetical protein VLH09_02005, partial [Bryobacteraceae bacterium]|nr:hypothetical protein [Bryobacteraceae bacterium]